MADFCFIVPAAKSSGDADVLQGIRDSNAVAALLPDSGQSNDCQDDYVLGHGNSALNSDQFRCIDRTELVRLNRVFHWYPFRFKLPLENVFTIGKRL
jgi:hypothetical protein